MASAYSYTNTYKETKLKTATQGQVIVMLYDEAIRQLDFAKDQFNCAEPKLDKINTYILKARDVITELMVSLDMENGGEFAKRMFSLYSWFNQQLLDANFKKSAEPIDTVKGFLVEIREAWNQIAAKTHVQSNMSTGINIAG